MFQLIKIKTDFNQLIALSWVDKVTTGNISSVSVTGNFVAPVAEEIT